MTGCINAEQTEMLVIKKLIKWEKPRRRKIVSIVPDESNNFPAKLGSGIYIIMLFYTHLFQNEISSDNGKAKRLDCLLGISQPCIHHQERMQYP